MKRHEVKPQRQETDAISTQVRGSPGSADKLALIQASLDDDKAEDIVVIDLSKKAAFADYMVVASGRSDRHVGAMADRLVGRLRRPGAPDVPLEGTPQNDWVLVDAGDIVVHLFRPEIRDFYKLEKLWSDVDEAAPARRARRA